MRTLTTAANAQTTETTVRLALFVELDFPSGFVRFWSGYNDITWDSKTWTASGTLGEIGASEETIALSPRNMILSLSGIPSEVVSIALAENYQNRPGRIWLAFLNSSGAIILDPILIFSGRMDTMGMKVEVPVCGVSVNLENRLVDLTRPRNRYFTRESQRIYYPNDKGFDYIPTLQQASIPWGITNQSAMAGSSFVQRPTSSAAI